MIAAMMLCAALRVIDPLLLFGLWLLVTASFALVAALREIGA